MLVAANVLKYCSTLQGPYCPVQVGRGQHSSSSTSNSAEDEDSDDMSESYQSVAKVDGLTDDLSLDSSTNESDYSSDGSVSNDSTSADEPDSQHGS